MLLIGTCQSRPVVVDEQKFHIGSSSTNEIGTTNLWAAITKSLLKRQFHKQLLKQQFYKHLLKKQLHKELLKQRRVFNVKTLLKWF